MEVQVEGEYISPSEAASADWCTIHRRHRQMQNDSLATATTHSSLVKTTLSPDRPLTPPAQGQPRPAKTTRRVSPPALPTEDYKIILRPRSGLALATLSEISLIRIIQGSAGIPLTKRKADRIKICATPNFVIISTPVEEHVPLYLNASTLNIQGKDHSFNAHVAAPAGTSVGIIHGIPLEDSPDTVLSTLQQHNPNVPILSTRRLGATGSIQVLFDGSLIPFWLAYDGAQRRCTPFRHRREACTNCWSTGHRRDVCPNPATSRCITCGLEHPEPGHACTPKCIVCHEEHPTGHPSCSQRFQKRRRLPGQQETGQKAKFRNLTSTVDTGQQERTLGLETSPTPFPSTLRAPSPAYNSTLKPATQTPLFPTRDRSRSRSRSRSQSRSRSRSRSSAISQQEARASSDGNGSPKGQQASSLGDLGSNQQRRTHKVSWAEAARAAPPKHTPTPLPSPSNSSYQIELASLREENRRQREEIAWLKGMVRQLTPSNTSTTSTPIVHQVSVVPPTATPTPTEQPGGPNPKKRAAPEPAHSEPRLDYDDRVESLRIITTENRQAIERLASRFESFKTEILAAIASLSQAIRTPPASLPQEVHPTQ